MDNLFIKKDDENGFLYLDTDFKKPFTKVLTEIEVGRFLNSVTWVGEGDILGEQHGEFLSELSELKGTSWGINRIYYLNVEPPYIEIAPLEGAADISDLFSQLLAIYSKTARRDGEKTKQRTERLSAHVHSTLLSLFLSDYIKENSIKVVSAPDKQTLEEEQLSDVEFVEGKFIKMNGEILLIKNILEEDPTKIKLLAPTRLPERYMEKDKEVMSSVTATYKSNPKVLKDVLTKIGEFKHLKHRVPELDSTFILNREVYVDFIKLFTSRGFSKILLSGDSGVGKSELVQQVCARMNMPLMRIDFSGEIISEQILWSLNFNPETKKMEVVEGVIPYCVRNGVKLCLEEFSSIPPSVAFELHRLFEKGSMYIKDNDTLIEPHPNFSIIATDNRIGNPNFQKYFGTQQQNAALISRIDNCLWIPYPEKKIEFAYLSLKFYKVEELVVINQNNITQQQLLLDLIIDFSNDVRSKYISGDISFTISPRELVSFFRSFYKLEDLQKAFEYSIMNFHKGFQSDEQAILQLFEKYFGKKPVVQFASRINKIEDLKINLFDNAVI